jgi:tRNA 2-thiouridine synthesizing protein D
MNLSDQKLHYTLVLTESPSQIESNLTAQKLAVEILAAGDVIDRVFLYQDACYIALGSQVPGQGLSASYQGWHELHENYQLCVQACIANSLRRGVLDKAEAQRYLSTENIHSSFELVGLGELAEACRSSDRIITL